MAPAERSWHLGRFPADEVAPTETLHVMRLQRLRLRRAAEGCLDPITEEDDYAGTSSRSSTQDDDLVLAGSPSAHNSCSSTTVDLAQSRR
ncbi:hypothetical protein TRIUR3_24810 [Triticum urartu]|uniref:Uncharacterized protein n=2 Tax=Triticum TaxID=4564 RepID=A0A9R1B598_TRITD|nr:uncharacterized protein LOC119314789 [Triticum dicoccoides]XP_048534136.1 uncharacterized protein LOC125513141 [Triticum urartu]EMS49698.1 hypothetical protein TRIUR3_24810 [Triticum urartu]VAI52020.1 unnamed protein product [Triticum turgidum subsp. durum]